MKIILVFQGSIAYRPYIHIDHTVNILLNAFFKFPYLFTPFILTSSMLLHFSQNTQNDVHFSNIKVHKCISLESIMFLYYKKQVISEILDVNFSVLRFWIRLP